MPKKITINTIDKILNRVDNLERQEHLERSYDEAELKTRQAIVKDIKELNFHISRFESEGADLETIQTYELIMEYVDFQLENQNYSSCIKILTALKLLSDIDLTFFTALPYIRENIAEYGPLTLESLANQLDLGIRKNIDPRDGDDNNIWRN